MITLVDRDEALRKIVHLAVEAGRKRQSPQTGLVHLHYHSDEDRHDTIPVYENVLFALALMQSRIGDNIREGREILERILKFRSGDNFPIYLHDYPVCHDRTLAKKLSLPLQIIWEDFGNLLGELPLKELIQEHEPLSTPSFSEWNSQIGCYTGPHYNIYYHGYEQQVTLVDLQMAYLTGIFPKRVLKDTPIHLHGVLIRPSDDLYELTPDCSESFNPNPPEKHFWKGHAYYSHVWGTPDRMHSLLLQGGNIRHCRKEGTSFLLELADPIENDDRLDQREICFYMDHQPATILVNQLPSNTFRIGDEVAMKTDQKTVTFRFQLESGQGEFMGHVMGGNRPGQLACKGKDRYEAYDWQIFLRTIRRSEPCTIKVSVEFS